MDYGLVQLCRAANLHLKYLQEGSNFPTQTGPSSNCAVILHSPLLCAAHILPFGWALWKFTFRFSCTSLPCVLIFGASKFLSPISDESISIIIYWGPDWQANEFLFFNFWYFCILLSLFPYDTELTKLLWQLAYLWGAPYGCLQVPSWAFFIAHWLFPSVAHTHCLILPYSGFGGYSN